MGSNQRNDRLRSFGPLFWIIVALTLVLGAGMFLPLPGERLLADRAEALGMWPDRKDVPRRPWRIWPGW